MCAIIAIQHDLLECFRFIFLFGVGGGGGGGGGGVLQYLLLPLPLLGRSSLLHWSLLVPLSPIWWCSVYTLGCMVAKQR